MRTIVATYTARKLLPVMSLLAAVVLLFFALLAFTDAFARPQRGVISGIVAGVLSSLLLITLLRQLVFCKHAAVWIEQGRVIHLHRWYQSIDQNEIVEILPTILTGTDDKPCILIRTLDGREREIPTMPLSESRETVITRLKENLRRL